MARILITGANGFIGKHLARHLADLGHLVTGLGHGIWPTAEANRWGLVDWLNGDVHAANLRALKTRHDPELIFHLAGGSSVGAAIANPREDFFRTVGSTAELIEWIRLDVPNVRLIAVSSAAIYGAGMSGPISESTIGAPFSPYGYHKQMMELLCHSYADTYGLNFRIARLFSVYGPHLKKQLLWDMCTRLAAGESPLVLSGTGQEVRDWTHVSDVVDALTRIACNSDPALLGQAINIGTGIGTSVKVIAQYVLDAWHERLSGREKPFLRFSGQSRDGDPFSLVANTERLSSIGFSWGVPVRAGVGSFVDWFLCSAQR